jgi:hypothetical protein
MSSDEFKFLMGPVRRPAGSRLFGDDDEFRILMGGGAGKQGRPESFVSQVARATKDGWPHQLAGR